MSVMIDNPTLLPSLTKAPYSSFRDVDTVQLGEALERERDCGQQRRLLSQYQDKQNSLHLHVGSDLPYNHVAVVTTRTAPATTRMQPPDKRNANSMGY